jgi:murein L,D-transpeptidase YcbB/YkuD
MKVDLSSRSLCLFGLLMTLCLFPHLNLAAPPLENASHTTSVTPRPLHFNWLANEQTLTLAEEGLSFISACAKQGLAPEDYHLTRLQQLLLTSNPQQHQQFNHLFTQSLLALIHDLKVGKWLAIEADPDWFIPQETFDSETFLSHALQSQHLRNHLDLLIPSDTEYQTLVDALARYQSYVEHGGWSPIPPTPILKLGDQHPHIALIQSRLAMEDKVIAMTHAFVSDLYDPLMEQAVRRFQRRNGLKADGIIGKNTLKTMNITAGSRVKQLKVNLERRRWLPDTLGDRYIFINLANYRLQAFDNDQEHLSMNIIVGKKKRQTPSFSAQMSHMVFNPYWHVPSKLARLDLLPKQQQNPHYLYRHGIRVFSVASGQKTEQNPYTIDWQSMSNHRPLPYIFRQDPGKQNSLGRIKFMFKNPWAIYLHDTPSKSLFNKTQRAFSSGCIRVADPINLAQFSLAGHRQQGSVIERIQSKRNHGLHLKAPLNIFAVYFTVSAHGNDVLFFPDVYQRDQRMIKNLY